MGTLQGFVGLLCGLQIVTHAMGFSSGGFVESCTSLLPDHSFGGVDISPQSGAPPYKVNAIAGEGESIIVRLGSTSPDARRFTGFMVDVRKSENVPAKGSFVEFGPGSTGLKCDGIQDSAVTQKSNVQKTFVQVKWQAQENGSSSFFLRATFVDNFSMFWSPVNVTIQTPATTTPSTTTLTSEQSSTPAPEGPSSTPDLGQPSDNGLSRLYLAEASLICSLTINGNGFLQPPTMKLFRILQWTLSLAAETISLTLLCIWDSGYIPPIALVSVVLFTSLLGYCLLIASLAIGPSHELKKIHDGVSKVVTILHEVLLLAAIFLCLWKIEESDVMKICCDSLLLLGAMAGYAAWRFLFILIFLFIIFLFKTTMAQRNRRGLSIQSYFCAFNVTHSTRENQLNLLCHILFVAGNDYTDSRCRKSTVIIFNLGNIAFAIALIVLMFPCF
ncbi:uncharacterized protein LOC130393639 isoform X4 [Gadus chalcogrammus]|uniref:uncharacterized protein LOC130393639 isoform X4 n=1 Tax=Gadus chalcogrammus TaxID=1042646 RepID=UPI0024C47A89|nr:uncharacterized protein LOC130393639 isoform X4 [Gadus chalcogrammus]